MNSILEEIIKFSHEKKYEALNEVLNKHCEYLIKHANLDGFILNFDISSNTLVFLHYLKSKFILNIITTQLLEIFYQFIETANKEQLVFAKDTYSQLFHLYSQYLIDKKLSYVGIEYLITGIKNIQNSATELTPLHTDFLHLCLTSRILKPALSLLDQGVFSISQEKWDSKYLLLYFYYGGIIYLAFKKFSEAFYFFDTGLTIPANFLSLIMVEMYKKYIITSLILHMKVLSLPKYTSNLLRMIKPLCQPYVDLANLFAKGSSDYNSISNKIVQHTEVFQRDGNMGLIKTLKKAFLVNLIKHISKIYTTITITQLREHIRLPTDEVTKKLLNDMITRMEFCAKLVSLPNQAADYIVFYDKNPESFDQSNDELNSEMQNCLGRKQILEELSDKIALNPQYMQKLMGLSDENMISYHAKQRFNNLVNNN